MKLCVGNGPAMDKHLFIFGFGFSSQAIAEMALGEFASICGTTRGVEKAETLRQQGYQAVLFDGLQISTDIEFQLEKCTHLVMSISPGNDDPVLAILPVNLKKTCPNLQWIGYLSTVGVYGNHDGAWISEETEPKPVSKRSVQRINAEQAWQTVADKANVPLCIFRLSGIYGPGRNAFVTITKGKARRLIKPGQVFNRIHREDIGKSVGLAMRGNIDGIFNITDDEPAPPQDVVTYAHKLMGIEPPAEIDFEAADLTPMARSFYGENKRVSNAKSKTVLAMEYDRPNYRVSLKRMWDESDWQ